MVHWVIGAIVFLAGSTADAQSANPPAEVQSEATAPHHANYHATHLHATRLIARVIEQLALGDSFDAKIRQRVWVGGREVIGVGTYEQAGGGSGRFNLQVAMHDGDGKHTLQQISDGRLAWTREQIGEKITLQRVDVGRLDQWVHGASLSGNTASGASRSVVGHLPPSVRVGGLTEMLERLITDFDLKLVACTLDGREMWAVRGSLKTEVRQSMLVHFPNNEWPELCPTETVVAFNKTPDPETGFGQGIPTRFEFWTTTNSDLPAGPSDERPSQGQIDATLVSAQSSQESEADPVRPENIPPQTGKRLVSLIELYSIRRIQSPPIGRFRFDNQDMEVNFTNETDRYLNRYGIRITERQSRMLRR